MNLKESMGKALVKGIQKLGIRPDDIADLLDDFDIDGFISDRLEEIKDSDPDADEIILAGFVDSSGKFSFSAVSLNVIENPEDEDKFIISKKHEMTFLDDKKVQSFTVSQLIKGLIHMLFDHLSKKKKRKKK